MILSKKKWEEALHSITGKVDITLLAKSAAEEPKNIKALWSLAINSTEPICQRSGWVLEESARIYPNLVIETLQKALPADVAHSYPLQRHFFKIWSEYSTTLIPEIWVGDMFDKLVQQDVPIAVKAHIMNTLYKWCEYETELAPELESTIQFILPNGSKGIQSRGKKTLKKLQQLKAVK